METASDSVVWLITQRRRGASDGAHGCKSGCRSMSCAVVHEGPSGTSVRLDPIRTTVPRAANGVGLTALGEASPKTFWRTSDEDHRAISGPLTPVTSGLSQSLADTPRCRSDHATGPDGTDSQADSAGSIPVTHSNVKVQVGCNFRTLGLRSFWAESHRGLLGVPSADYQLIWLSSGLPARSRGARRRWPGRRRRSARPAARVLEPSAVS